MCVNYINFNIFITIRASKSNIRRKTTINAIFVIKMTREKGLTFSQKLKHMAVI